MSNSTNTAERTYALNHDQTAQFISKLGHAISVLVRGNMGVGKTSLLDMIGKLLPKHKLYYADCSTMDIPDVAMYDINNSTESLNFIYNDALGLHEDVPIVLMLDEFGKSNPSVKLMLLRLILERTIGNRKLHPDSVVFMTTNLDGEGVGDLLPAHACNRMTVVELAKPDHMQWIDWGIANELDPIILGWVKDNPHVMADWRDIQNPDDNHYIFHPRAVGRTQFCTPRSLHKASDILKQRAHIDEHTLTSGLVGCIGASAAMDLMAFVKLADQLPTYESHMSSPDNATLPTSPSALCMVVYRALGRIERSEVTAWLKYMARMPAEAQALFVNGVMAKGYDDKRQKAVTTHADFGKWCLDNNHMIAKGK